MLDWDMDVAKSAADNQLEISLHSRYVDDTSDAAKALDPELRWEEGRLVMKLELVEQDQNIPGDERTLREFVKLGSSVNPVIQLTGDCPSNQASGKMPALDILL